jgi:AcrR family transcriptional regulator
VRLGEAQRARIVGAALRVVGEVGYRGLSVARVADRARVSRRTFYEVFADCEECFVAVFEDALVRVSEQVEGAYGVGGGSWQARVRAALGALLVLFEEEPQLASLLVVDALGGGPRVLERRAEMLRVLSARLQADGVRASRHGGGVAPLTGEGVVGGVLSVLYARLSERGPGGMVELTSQLTGMVVLPYLGQRAATRELARPVLERRGARSFSSGRSGGLESPTRLAAAQGDPLVGLPMRLTYRTLRVLEEVADWPGASNRGIAERVGISDQGQASKLLARLARLGLLLNTGEGHARGQTNAWSLTQEGRRVLDGVRGRAHNQGRVFA